MMTTFENSLPEVFFKKMSKEVITVGKTYEKSAKKNFTILDTDIILTRVLYLLNRDVELKNIFHYELAPMPTSLFKTNFEANYPQNKSTLLNILKVDQSPITQKKTCFVIDGGTHL